MKLGLVLGYSGGGYSVPMDLVLEAERLGFDSVWSSEAYGSDAATPLAYVAARTERIRIGTAILQMPARTPAMAAMTAMTLDAMSGGRFVLGLGPSGPQVVEGWHGVAYGRPLTRTREYVSIVRAILAREAPATHQGFHYQLPYRGEDGTGLGKPLKSILHGRADMPIYTASITPKGLALAAEIADGVFPVWMSPDREEAIRPHLETGFAVGGAGRDLSSFDVAAFVACHVGDDLGACRAPVKSMLALYVGGMGARGRNFYTDYTARLGYEAAAAHIQDLFLAGRRQEAAAAVPDALVDEVALVGPPARIRERADAWKAAGRSGLVGSVLAKTTQVEALRVLAESFL
jgi:F420-dependent oxidoreductase-like protein